MSDVTSNALRGIVKTLNDVVSPAIPADDPLAVQELKMVVRYLAFLRERVDHMHARARFELDVHARMADECRQALGSADAASGIALDALIERARKSLGDASAPTAAVRALTQEIMTRLTRLLREVQEPGVLTRIERAIVSRSEEVIAFDRAWYLPLKFERFPSEVRPLSAFIAMHDKPT